MGDAAPPVSHPDTNDHDHGANDRNAKDSYAADAFPGGYDDTPVPPPADGFAGYTVRFTFVRATNLPVADFDVLIGQASSDPFVHATLTTAVASRHPGLDPPLVHRTRTLHRTTEPVWDEHWVVAGIPRSGFRLKCRIYDEDAADHDDRLGNVTVAFDAITDDFCFDETLPVKKRMGSKRAYLIKAAATAVTGGSITPTLDLRIQVLGESDGPGGRVYTVGPTRFVRHFSPMIGRLTNTVVNRDERADEHGPPPRTPKSPGHDPMHDYAHGQLSPPPETGRASFSSTRSNRSTRSSRARIDHATQKYDFQATEMQLAGPVPAELYHRFVEFRPIIGRMFSRKGVRGFILNKALHKQHNRVYNYSRTTEYGEFDACSPHASLQFLRLAHFDEGGRIFTYVLSLDGVFRFTETGKEFGIDMLSKHSMHADVAMYIAFSGEFFVRRLSRPLASSDAEPPAVTHPDAPVPGGPPQSPPPHEPGYYQLVIDNGSGTYRPDKKLLPVLQAYMERNFPGLGVVAMHWEDDALEDMKAAQRSVKTREGRSLHMVLNRCSSGSSLGSSNSSALSDLDDAEHGHRTKKQLAWDLMEDPSRIRDLSSAMFSHSLKDKA